MPEQNPKPYPQVNFGLGETNRFVNEIQRALNIVETGVYDFLTMCHVVVHKFQHGLNAADPSIDQNTWNSIVNGGRNAGTETPEPQAAAPAAPAAVAGGPAAAAAPRVTTAAPAAPAAAAAPTAGPATVPAPTAAPVDVTRAATEAAGPQDGINAKEQAAAGGPTIGVEDRDPNNP